ncbi:NAD(P)/FAD-dependent oxidoreductase [Alicyclobacillus dauci]|uniref:NAD(P)/FAD-dependent oxidoreductase n=1 Tax=Alicyclobacillus dauci TaxID=1475485 RepID=A0ABY6Z0I3_9BACL|nr:NAD(P)/FAD-dependent oxidoreductase [Alicyclobacillus dauci]WAH36232.1 NAD(P)/FAD-dependent oxidoreductase [Alicyclobacillus dauci]
MEASFIYTYDCIIVGGGISGLQAAVQLGRYRHNILVVDSDSGRSTLCKGYHNILGWPDGIAGPELRRIGHEQATQLGVTFEQDEITDVSQSRDGFVLQGVSGQSYSGKRLLLATGIVDNIPSFPGIEACLGLSIYVCPDCDGYEITGKRTIVFGAGDVGANMALTLSYWSSDIIYIDHDEHGISAKLQDALAHKDIPYIRQPIRDIVASGGCFQGVVLSNGEELTGERGFMAFGGNEVKSSLAKQLGVDLHKNQHILVDPRTKETNVRYVWAAGDVVAHSEQVTIAMGEGSQAAIWIHKSLMS